MISNSTIGLIALALGTQAILVSALPCQAVKAVEITETASAKLLSYHSTVVAAYEPPPDIGAPRRTSGSGGR